MPQKLDSSGNGIWIIGIDSGSGANIATDAIGDVYVSGGFTGSTFTLGSIVLTDDSTYGGGFLAKLDTTLSTGIHDLSNENLKLYPNPTTDMLTINNLPLSATLTISDMTGRVYTTTLSGQYLDVSALPAGVYCLHIEDSGEITTKKFVKE